MLNIKKQITSLPSTHHQQQVQKQSTQSVLSLVEYSQPQVQLSKIVKQMKRCLQYRIYLLQRDMLQIYNNSSSFIKQYLHYNNPNQLWLALDIDRDDVLLEKEQLVFLTKFLSELIRRKSQYANQKKYNECNDTGTLLTWFQAQIVQYEKLLRSKVKDKLIRRADRTRRQNQISFQKQQEHFIQQIQKHKQQQYQTLTARASHQKSILQNQLVQRVSHSIHKFKPSLDLQKAKDLSLIAKLAPYRHEKKRAYECEELHKNLTKTLQLDLNRQQRQIEHYKQVQRQRLRNSHKVQKIGIDQRLRLKEDRVINNIRNRKYQLEKSQNIRLQKTVKESDRLANQRVSWIRNSLRAYSQRQQTKKIRSIVRYHKGVTQFINDAQEVCNSNISNLSLTCHYNSSLQSPTSTSYKYTTISNDMNMGMKDLKRRRYENVDYQDKLMAKIKREHDLLENDGEYHNQLSNALKMTSLEKGSGRKSLVDLYDNDLSLV